MRETAKLLSSSTCPNSVGALVRTLPLTVIKLQEKAVGLLVNAMYSKTMIKPFKYM